MRLKDIEYRLDEARIEIDSFVHGLGGRWDVEVLYEDGLYIKVYGLMEFIEIASDEWGDYYTEIVSDGFQYEDELLDFLYELQL